MKEFNYQDYLKYQILKKKEKSETFELHDVSIPYKLENRKVNKPHDKIFKLVLSEKKQAVRIFK